MGVTVSPTDLGLRGHFYFHFFFYQPLYFFVASLGVWSLLKAETHIPSVGDRSSSDPRGSSSKDASHQKQAPFPTFSIEELNAGQTT